MKELISENYVRNLIKLMKSVGKDVSLNMCLCIWRENNYVTRKLQNKTGVFRFILIQQQILLMLIGNECKKIVVMATCEVQSVEEHDIEKWWEINFGSISSLHTWYKARSFHSFKVNWGCFMSFVDRFVSSFILYGYTAMFWFK